MVPSLIPALPYSSELVRYSAAYRNINPKLPLRTALKSLPPIINREEHVLRLSDPGPHTFVPQLKTTMAWVAGPVLNLRDAMLVEL